MLFQSPLRLSSRNLPWVVSATNLGHELHVQLCLSPEILKALKVYCSSFFVCMQWDLGGDKATQDYNSLNMAMKLTWNCPTQTETFLVQQVLSVGMFSARIETLAKYVTFFKGFRASQNQEIRTIVHLTGRDILSTTGKNMKTIREASGLDPWQASPTRKKVALHNKGLVEIVPQDRWRVAYLHSLLRQHLRVYILPLILISFVINFVAKLH